MDKWFIGHSDKIFISMNNKVQFYLPIRLLLCANVCAFKEVSRMIEVFSLLQRFATFPTQYIHSFDPSLKCCYDVYLKNPINRHT